MSEKEPLLLVEITNGNLFANKKNLTALLSTIQDTPLAIVSIAGPANTGKSLLFGYLARYFIAAEQDILDWIDRDNPNRKLDEFQWPTDKSPNQPGIWSFPRPIVISSDSSSTKQAAVLLLYCQCSNKSVWNTDSIDLLNLLGLTAHISSITIYNISKRLDEECLNAIATSIKLAAHVFTVTSSNKKGKKSQIPFQDACFVIRDWNFSSQFSYGNTGGTKYVNEEKLSEKNSHNRKQRENRCMIKELFSTVTGCLLPFPGTKFIALTEHTCSLFELGKEFSDHLADSISTAINIDDVTLNVDSNKEQITGKKFSELLQRFLDISMDIEICSLNTRTLLRGFRIKLGNSLEEQKSCIKPALKAYADAWKKYDKAGKLLDEKMLKDVQKRARAKALATLEMEIVGKREDEDLSSDSDNDEQILQVDETVKKELIKRVLQKFEEIKEEQARKKEELIAKHKQDLLHQFQESIEIMFPLESKPPTQKRFTREVQNLKITLKTEFLEKHGAGGDKDSWTNEQKHHVQELMDKLEIEEKNCFQKIFLNDDEESLGFEDGSSISGSDFGGSQRNESFLSLNRSILHGRENVSSRQSETSSNSEDFDLARRTSSRARKVDRAARQNLKRAEERLIQETKQLVERLTTAHRNELEKCIDDISINLEELQKQILEEHLDAFDNQFGYDKNRCEYTTYREILDGNLKIEFSTAMSKRKQVRQKHQDAQKTATQNALETYTRQLENVIAKTPDVTLPILELQNTNLVVETLNNFPENLKSEQVLNDLEAKMANSFVKCRGRVKAQKQTTPIPAQKMHQKLSVPQKQSEVLRKHEFTVKELSANLPNLDKNPKLVNEVGNNLQNTFVTMQDKTQLKSEEQTSSAKLAIKEATNYYCQEMRKVVTPNQSLSPFEIIQKHRKVCAETKKKFSKSNAKELSAALDLAFRQFEEENAMNQNDEEPAIGIDLGTTYCCVSVYQKGKVVILPNSIGKYTTPSYVQFQTGDKEIIGEPAKIKAYENPEGTIFDAKRILGRKFNEKVLQHDMKLWPFTVVDDGHGVPMIEVNGKRYNPEMISAKILAQLKKDAEVFLKRKVNKAVITVPAYFTDGQKQATIDAGKMAGLEVLSILTEPVAAAMAYKLHYSAERTGAKHRHILVFDLGGGTFDVAIVKASKGNLDVVTVDGDTHLGGEDFDKNLMNYCADEFKKEHGVDLFEGKDSLVKKTRDEVRRRLKRIQAVCEMQKIALSLSKSVDVTVGNIYNGMDLEVTVSRATFEKINEPLFTKTIKVVENALLTAKLHKKQIDDIVLVGGSTRIPKVKQLLRDFFNGKNLDQKINPDEAVAHGAGLMAAIKQGNISKDSSNFTKIRDVTPMSIGVEVYGGGFSAIIPRNTKTPVMLKERYKTAHKNQTSVQITIYEGEDKIAVKNKHLGDFYLNGIPPKDAGVENIDVEMVINDQGILHVTAKCSSTGKQSAVTVTENKQRMGKAAIERYLAEGKP